MRKYILYFIVVLMILFSCKKTIEKKIEIIPVKIYEQNIHQRVWKKCNFDLIAKIKSDSLYNPISLKVDNEENIYVYDLPKQKIKMISNEGKYIEYGSGRGKGPKEFLNLTDYYIDSLVYIVDPNLSKVAIFKKDGRFIEDFKLKKIRPYRFVSIGKYYLIRPVNLTERLFILLDKNFKKISEIGNFFEYIEPIKRSILFDGKLCTNGIDKIYYGFLYSGIIAKYDIINDTFEYYNTIDKTKLPQIEKIAGGKGVKAPKKSPKACIDIFFDDDKVYILTNTTKNKEPVLDVYNSNLSYLFSFRLPSDKIYSLKIKNKKLFALLITGEILIWQIKFV
ncbi:hypothetical protein Calab_1693 [Caldithrix abyssi DSM 13497]|uniref:6-bladed beta-propeller n=1 Tax=Caldithrix abyssi DSM 13497 TaxID=880073 RepID=H1XRV1_CALAY|nr:6-bladed beta-propeller [Caldithrix abyssi]APF17173.1 hypothetical protein Cabys_422 [Caldithrix abyssi DSM 13497]EHO41311.1 hypothetical protein Calab_1693 [Caldithrix abyssi DSM 13497]